MVYKLYTLLFLLMIVLSCTQIKQLDPESIEELTVGLIPPVGTQRQTVSTRIEKTELNMVVNEFGFKPHNWPTVDQAEAEKKLHDPNQIIVPHVESRKFLWY